MLFLTNQPKKKITHTEKSRLAFGLFQPLTKIKNPTPSSPSTSGESSSVIRISNCMIIWKVNVVQCHDEIPWKFEKHSDTPLEIWLYWRVLYVILDRQHYSFDLFLFSLNWKLPACLRWSTTKTLTTTVPQWSSMAREEGRQGEPPPTPSSMQPEGGER